MRVRRRWGVLPGKVLLWDCTLPHIGVRNEALDAHQHNDPGVAYEQRGKFDVAARTAPQSKL